ncbi:hypothetical protein [Sulfitobacter sp. DFL-23]|uniref:hypothetical protein n=1 Tax=Roseobacteraceae TaxID=2854170 RepID=UPI001966A6D5|nr:hypothetical protein [Sulfitobacter sp. DFL-23]
MICDQSALAVMTSGGAVTIQIGQTRDHIFEHRTLGQGDARLRRGSGQAQTAPIQADRP